MKAALISFALLAATSQVHAEDTVHFTEADCATMDVGLAPGWEAWLSPGNVTAAAKAADQPEIVLGKAYAVQLQPADKTMYEVEPRKGVTPATYGGLLMLTIPVAGNYTVALGNKVWVDIIKDGQVVNSTSHNSSDNPCLPILKTVTFSLTPGVYTLQLANAPAATVTVEIKAG